MLDEKYTSMYAFSLTTETGDSYELLSSPLNPFTGISQTTLWE